MYKKGRYSNLIILGIVALLFLLLVVILTMLKILENEDNTINITNQINVTSNIITKKGKTVQEVLESYGVKLIKRDKEIFIKTYVNFKYDLYDTDGNSRKQYFYDLIEDIVKVEKDTFYLIDSEKNIEIHVQYDKETERYKVIINDIENYYNETDGETYVNLNNAKIVEKGNFYIDNTTITTITHNNMYYTGTKTLFTDFDSREELGNGYYAYKNGTMITKLQSGRIINLVLTKDFDEEIVRNVYVTTPLDEIYNKYDKVSFGGINEGYLGYRTDNEYVFLYEDEVSIYASQYTERKEFDEYLLEYCKTGDLEKLYNDFSKNWGNYYENSYAPELQNLKLSYPSRGIEIDIEGNDSRGIKIYNNYYLTTTVKELIEDNKITLVPDKDLVYVVEQARRENSK